MLEGLLKADPKEAPLNFTHLEKAFQRDAEGSFHYQLARAYQAAGQAELAKQALEKYQQIQRTQPQPPAIAPPQRSAASRVCCRSPEFLPGSVRGHNWICGRSRCGNKACPAAPVL